MPSNKSCVESFVGFTFSGNTCLEMQLPGQTIKDLKNLPDMTESFIIYWIHNSISIQIWTA